MVSEMNKKVLIGIALLLIGGLLIANGLGVAEEKKDPVSTASSPGLDGMEERWKNARENVWGKPPSSPTIPEIIIAGAISAIGGIIFLAKSKDEKFLPNI